MIDGDALLRIEEQLECYGIDRVEVNEPSDQPAVSSTSHYIYENVNKTESNIDSDPRHQH